MKSIFHELVVFSIRNALCCVFPLCIFFLLAISHLMPSLGIPRYDFLLIGCLAVQVLMVYFGLETRDEALVICLFHVLGIMMEVFKVNMGSWSYPEFAFTKFFGVPLYSGFMYASVASYMCQAWKRLNLNLVRWPRQSLAWTIAILIYLNFFSLHSMPDLRWLLFVLVFVIFFRSRVYFHTTELRVIPVSVSFALIGLFLWFAENIATLLGAWKYAYQHDQWHMVRFHKLSSWTLMSMVSYIIVAQLKIVKNSRLSLYQSQFQKAESQRVESGNLLE